MASRSRSPRKASALADGEYTMQQKSNMRFLDAFEDDTHDYAVVTRAAQGNDSQKWLLKAAGDGSYTIQQKVNMRFLDAFEDSIHDYALVTRAAQGNDSQKWLFNAADDGSYTIQQKVNMRFLDAPEEESTSKGRSHPKDVLRTRPARGDETQKWVIKATGGSPHFTINVENWTKALKDIKAKIASNKKLIAVRNFDGGDPDNIFGRQKELEKEYARLMKIRPPESKETYDKEVQEQKELEGQRQAELRRKDREWEDLKFKMKQETGNEFWGEC